MRLKTFTASDMQTAMKMIRESLGEHAVIISSAKDASGRQISITAAVEQEDDPAPDSMGISAGAVPDQPGKLAELLYFHNVPSALAGKMIAAARSGAGLPFSLRRAGPLPVSPEAEVLERTLSSLFSFNPLPLEAQGMTVMLIGLPGVGKTLTAARIAAQLVMQKQPAHVITTDNKRAGGVEQLSAFTGILGLELKVASSKGDLWQALREYPPSEKVIIDTAGLNPYDSGEIKELRELISIGGLEPVLVAAAGSDVSEAAETAGIFASLGARRLIITRADTARRFGGILAAADAGRLAFCNISSTSSIIGEFKPVDAVSLSNLLLHYRRQPC